MLEEKKIIDRNYLMNKRNDARLRSKFYAVKHRLFVVGIIMGLAIIIAFYLLSGYSKVYKVVVEGNVYYTDKQIVKLSGINEDSFHLFTFPFIVENRVKDDILIDSVKAKIKDNRIINIEVKEKKIVGYINSSDGVFYVLDDGTRMEMDKDNSHWINRVPLIEGYTDEQLDNIISGFKDIDIDLLNQISEIHRYPFTYDDNMLEVVMRDGNYVFISSFGLDLLNQYYSIVSGIGSRDESHCIYLDEVTNSGYSSSCPWNIETIENENESSNSKAETGE